MFRESLAGSTSPHGQSWSRSATTPAPCSALLQRGRRAFGAQNRIAVLRIVFRRGFLVVHSAHGDARGLSGNPPHGLARCQRSGLRVASLTLLPHGLIGSCWRPCSAPPWPIFGPVQCEIWDSHQGCISVAVPKSAGEHELLVVGWVTTFLIGGATTAIAVIMAASGQSVFQIMLTFNTLMSLAYGPPALLGLVVRRTLHGLGWPHSQLD